MNYCDWNEALNYDADVTMVVGAHGIGKTYGLQRREKMNVYKYEYDYVMIREMQLLLENDEIIHDCIQIIKSVYFSDDFLFDSFDVRAFKPEVITHAANYIYDYFIALWYEKESETFLQPEYFKACYMTIPELISNS